MISHRDHTETQDDLVMDWLTIAVLLWLLVLVSAAIGFAGAMVWRWM
jgi:hypothetical protein